MGLETATYIDSLVVTNPDGADARTSVDDHIRLIKATLKRTFPNIAGEVSVSHGALNAAVRYDVAATISGTWSFAAPLTAGSAFRLSGVLSPAEITSDQDDYNPTGLAAASILRISTDTQRTITGIAGGTAGRILIVACIGPGNLILAHEDTGSSAANRFSFASSLDIIMAPGWARMLWYDATASRWRALS